MAEVGCPLNLVSIRNNRNWNRTLVSSLSETKLLFRMFHFYTETASFGVSIEQKQTEDQPKEFDREHFFGFLRKFRVVSVYFGLFRNSCFSCFDIGSKHRNKTKLTETNQNFYLVSLKNRNTIETDHVLVCFASNQIFFFRFEDTIGGSLPKAATIYPPSWPHVYCRGDGHGLSYLLRTISFFSSWKIPPASRHKGGENERW